MQFPAVTLADWRAQVDKELAGRSFEKALVHEVLQGLAIQPLYTEAPRGELLDRAPRGVPFRICMRQAAGTAAELVADVEGGADAAWVTLDEKVLGEAIARANVAGIHFVFDGAGASAIEGLERLATRAPAGTKLRFALNDDPLARRARAEAAFASLGDDLAALGRNARAVEDRFPGASAAMVSTLAYHDAGADAADELAIALATGVRYLEALREAGLSAEQAARQIAVQLSLGRDTFLQLCKVRALRACWRKLLAAAGAPGAPRTLVHAVCSSRTLAARDPWVNLLRATTQVFAGVLGGADLVTPSAFDQALGTPSVSGRRVARNTGLVLREESFLGKVEDPAGGSYYLETLTDALAREAWKRFQALEREGGIVEALESGRLVAKLTKAWEARLEKIAKRKTPILGVSEFANLDEVLPEAMAKEVARRATARAGGLPVHRDAEPFEALRAQAEAAPKAPEALLVTLGTLAETRPRAGFAAGFFAAGGIRSRESSVDETVPLACLCGTDDAYAKEAAPRARALKASGCGRVLVAGRPGALEATLREAGVNGFIYVGCDAVAVLGELVGVAS